MRLVVIAAIAALSGCAWQSGVLKLGENRYQVSANASPARGATTGARKMALSSANKKCTELGREIEVLEIETGYAFPTNGTATVTFLCN